MMDRHQLLGHAWSLLEGNPDWAGLDPSLKWFWLDVLLTIHMTGDGATLRCGQGFTYRSWPDVAAVLDVGMHEFETRTDRLVALGLLAWVDGSGLAMPDGLELRTPGRACEPAGPFVPRVIQGGRG